MGIREYRDHHLCSTAGSRSIGERLILFGVRPDIDTIFHIIAIAPTDLVRITVY
jgi:hypothetical protein